MRRYFFIEISVTEIARHKLKICFLLPTLPCIFESSPCVQLPDKATTGHGFVAFRQDNSTAFLLICDFVVSREGVAVDLMVLRELEGVDRSLSCLIEPILDLKIYEAEKETITLQDLKNKQRNYILKK